MNFPLASKICSTFPDSTPYNVIFPACDPEMMNLSSGLNSTVHKSTGPTSILEIFSPFSTSHIRKLESIELEAQAIIFKEMGKYINIYRKH